MMNKENQARVTISLYKEDIKQLNFICQDTGMSKSDAIRQLIRKAATDETNRIKITDKAYQERTLAAWESFKKRQKRLTSYNVQDEKNADPMTGDGDSSSNCREHDKTLEIIRQHEYNQLQQQIAIAQANWVPEDEW